jgi:spermidine/putrescine transport system ATP-binding protein
VGDAVEVFVRPEVALLARSAGSLPPDQPRHAGEVQSVLFDGANSAVLLQEQRTRREFRIALPQTGQFSDLKPHEQVVFSFDPSRAACFAARPGTAGQDV